MLQARIHCVIRSQVRSRESVPVEEGPGLRLSLRETSKESMKQDTELKILSNEAFWKLVVLSLVGGCSSHLVFRKPISNLSIDGMAQARLLKDCLC